jgi:amino acid adenylation domain-containing protein
MEKAPAPGPAGLPQRTLYQRFHDAAIRYGDAIAIEIAGEAVRYRQLADLADRMAARMTEILGDQPAVVGVLATRSLAAYCGYLAGLRLGATVVPLHADAPLARNARICETAVVDLLVADRSGERHLAGLSAATGAGMLVAYADDPASLREIAAGPWQEPYRATPDDVAYILFTSGSTGEAKGIPVRHRQLGDYLAYCQARYQPGPGARLVQGYGLTFDPSVLVMFLSWSSGAALVVPEADALLNPARLVTSQRISHWWSVPSVISLARRFGALPEASLPGLAWSVFAGEQLTTDQARAWAAAAPGSAIENAYGPTELTITCAAYRLPGDQADWPSTPNGTVPIGRVFPHLEAVLRQEDGTVVPAGERGAGMITGELCVRGSQRFDGYLDPAANQGRFIRCDGRRSSLVAGSDVPADSWFRTGDRVTRLGTGELVHRGRLDDQVKVDGHRVEPGEIESVLRGHPSVDDVVVLRIAGQRPSLCAVYTGARTVDAELAAVARSWLPAYMAPAHYRWVERMPLNANGKVDRQRLAAELDLPG